jgi:uncharacterized protein (TIGR02099 family)
MNRLFRACRSWGSLTAAALVVLLAVAVGVTRLLLPLLAEDPERLAAEVERQLGQPVEVGSVETDMRGLAPVLVLNGVTLLDPQGEVAVLQMRQLVVTLAPWRSLRARRPVVGALTLVGSELAIERRADGSIDIRGLGSPGAGRVAAPFAGLGELTLGIKESRLIWRDVARDQEHRFDSVSLLLALGEGRLRFAGEARLPDGLGRRVLLRGDVIGDLLDPHGWTAELYAAGSGLDLGTLPGLAGRPDLQGLAGSAEIEAWLRWDDGRLATLAAHADVREFAAEALRQPLSRAAFTAHYRAGEAGGWALALSDMQVSTVTGPLPTRAVEVALRPGAGGRELALSVDALELQGLADLAGLARPLVDHEQVLAWAPVGRVEGLSLRLRTADQEVELLGLKARFRDLGWAAQAAMPGLTGLDGEVRMDVGGGRLALVSEDVIYRQPGVFPQPLAAERLRAELRWAPEAAGGTLISAAGLRVESADAWFEGAGTLALGDAGPVIDLQGRFESLGTPRIAPYVPERAGAPARRWLARSLPAGRAEDGRLVLRGPLARFPFRAQEGVFEARFSARDTRVEYRPDWPPVEAADAELVFHNASMRARVERARILGAQVRGEVLIRDFMRTRVEVDADADGKLADVAGFISGSPLGRRFEDLLAELQTGGDARVALRLSLPASRRLDPKDREVQGRVRFSDARLALPSRELAFEAVEGPLDFTEHSVSSPGMTAEFLDTPIQISAQTDAQGRGRFDLRGRFAARDLLPPLPETLVQRVEGDSDWTGEVVLPGLTQASKGETPMLRMRSGLAGTRLDLPAPLGKVASETRSFDLRMPLAARPREPLDLSYGEVLHYRARQGSRGLWTERAELLIGRGEVRLPERGLRVALNLPALALDPWLEVMELPQKARGVGVLGEARAAALRVEALRADVGRLQVAGQTLESLKVDALREDEAWRALISASTLAGTLELPQPLDSGRPLILDLEYLALDPGEAIEDGVEGLDPRQLPALRIAAERLRIGERHLRDLRIEATRLADGLQFHALNLSGEGLELSGQGEWRRPGARRERTALRLVVETDDVGQGLATLGFADSGIQGGAGRAELTANWPAGPLDFGWEGLQGKATLALEDGRIETVEPGAGRLLGLFDLGSLARRVRLDFSDVFREGFGFDRIEGQLVARGADIYTSDLVVAGPAAEVTIQGRSNVEARVHDQTVTVLPNYGSGLPIAGFVLGGAGVGAAVLVVDRLLDIGGQISEANRLEYRVSGPWAEPEIELISAPPSQTEEETE